MQSGAFFSRGLKAKAFVLVLSLIFANVAALAALFSVSASHPALLSAGMLALTFGLRHAVDADHIAAIDNVTRKLIGDGKMPLTVGLWFSLGHSTVVCLLCVVVSMGSVWMRDCLPTAQNIGSIVGTLISSTTLFLIGGMNTYSAMLLWSRWKLSTSIPVATAAETAARADQKVAESPVYGGVELPKNSVTDKILHDFAHENGLDHRHAVSVNEQGEVTDFIDSRVATTSSGGIISRFCGRCFGAVKHEWQMYPIGLLFGLGFDTASEVALLGMAAMGSSQKDAQAVSVLVLPLLFTTGMSLIDTLDGIFMIYAYGWAAVHSTRKLLFNLFLTGMSAMIALMVGALEVLSLVEKEFDLPGPFFEAVAAINNHFELLGFGIIGFFAVATIVAIVTFKFVIEPTIPPTSGGTIESTASLTERTRLVALPSNGYSAKRNEDYVQRRIAQLARTPITHISVPDI